MNNKSKEERNEEIRERMLNIQQVEIFPMPDNSPWIKPVRMNFLQNNIPNTWDIIKSHNSVAIIVFNTSRRKFVFVRQFRPKYYFAIVPEDTKHVDVNKYPVTLGLTMELCAGMVDKDKSLAEIAVDELREECGYEVSPFAFEKINTYRSSVAPSSAFQTLFYVEVTDEMQKHNGGGVHSEGELIEIVEMSVEEAKNHINSKDIQSLSFLYGVTWFLLNKQDRYS